jgi:hypothetical protein
VKNVVLEGTSLETTVTALNLRTILPLSRR